MDKISINFDEVDKIDEIEVIAYIPIVTDSGIENFYPFEQKELILSEIKEVLINYDFKSQFEFSNKATVTFEIIENLPKTLPVISFDHYKYMKMLKEKFIKISLLIEIDYSKVILNGHGKKDTSFESLKAITKHTLCEIFSNTIFELLVISQIARPGSLKLRTGIITINNYSHTTIDANPHLREAFELAIELNYPTITFINFRKLWYWLQENNILFTNPPKNNLEKALNAFTHLFHTSDETIHLVYSMMALEIMYTRGNLNITEQLFEKIQIYLEPMKDYKKRLKQMYKARSDFFHGAIPVYPIHKEWDMGSFDAYGKNLYEATNLSKMILVATFQKMFLENTLELAFEYKLKK